MRFGADFVRKAFPHLTTKRFRVPCCVILRDKQTKLPNQSSEAGVGFLLSLASAQAFTSCPFPLGTLPLRKETWTSNFLKYPIDRADTSWEVLQGPLCKLNVL